MSSDKVQAWLLMSGRHWELASTIAGHQRCTYTRAAIAVEKTGRRLVVEKSIDTTRLLATVCDLAVQEIRRSE